MKEFNKYREQSIEKLKDTNPSDIYAHLFYSLENLHKLKENGRFTEDEWWCIKNTIMRLENLIQK